MISTRKRPLACLSLLAALAGRRLGVAAAPERGTVAIRLIAVNDLHGAVSADRAIDGRAVGGAAALAAHVARLRASGPEATLVVHAGDVVSASPVVSALLQDEPAIAVMNAIGCDVGVVGNHEFDEGVPELFRLLQGGSHPATEAVGGRFPGASFPCLAANVVWAESGEPLLPPYHVFEVQGVALGVIGVVTCETSDAVGGGAAGLRFLDEAETVNRYAAELRELGVRTIVVLAHLGGTAPAASGSISGPVADLARATDEAVAVIVSGHTHQGYAATVAGKLVTQAWLYGDGLAVIDLLLDRGTGAIVAKGARLVRTWQDEVDPDPAVAAMVAGWEAYAAPIVGAVVGEAARAITREADVAGEQALGDLIADAYRAETGADVALSHPGWNWADLPAGDLTWGALFHVQPANHDLVTLRLTGAQLVRALEQQWQPRRTVRLQVAGLTYAVAPDRPLGRRVLGPRVGDAPLDPAATYTVTVNTFLAGGGNGFTALMAASDRAPGPKDLDALLAHVRALPQPVDVPPAGRIRLAS